MHVCIVLGHILHLFPQVRQEFLTSLICSVYYDTLAGYQSKWSKHGIPNTFYSYTSQLHKYLPRLFSLKNGNYFKFQSCTNRMKFGNKSSYFNLFMATFFPQRFVLSVVIRRLIRWHGISCPLLISSQFCEVERLCAQVEGIPDDPWFVKFAEAIKLWEIWGHPWSCQCILNLGLPRVEVSREIPFW